MPFITTYGILFLKMNLFISVQILIANSHSKKSKDRNTALMPANKKLTVSEKNKNNHNKKAWSLLFQYWKMSNHAFLPHKAKLKINTSV